MKSDNWPLLILVLLGMCILIAKPGKGTEYPIENTVEIYRKPVENAHIRCLAEAIYFEARGESVRGQRAVGSVIRNRVADPTFPSTICGVVYQSQTRPSRSKVFRVPIKHKCQFSYFCDGKPETIKEKKVFKQIHRLAVDLFHNPMYDVTNGATFYHAEYVSPAWKQHMKLTVIIGQQMYYARW